MYIMTILTTKRNGYDMIEIRDVEIEGFEWRDNKFRYIKWCRYNELEDDEGNKETLIGLREK